jgi:delta-aminolevulinic acid dehydratase/porphobilinogen synthase
MDPYSAMAGPMQIATGAIRQSVHNLARDAHVVANSRDVMTHDTVEALIDARQQVIYAKAGARVISAADEMLGSLLDVRA